MIDFSKAEPINPPPPPPRLSMAAFRLALHRLGLLAQVEAFMGSPVTTVEQKILWEYSTEVSRDDPTLAALAEALGFTDAQIDEVFQSGGPHAETDPIFP